jgi:tetratricopeptide (TPR) repeat protein
VRLVPTSSTYLEDLARSSAFQALASDPSGATRKLALDAAVRATEVDPVSPSPRYLYAQIAFLFGDFATALDQATRAIRIYPIAPEYEPVALQAAAKVDPPVARTALEEIAALRDTAPVRLALAKVDLALGDTAAARANAKRALELAPGNAEAQSVLQQAGGGP